MKLRLEFGIPGRIIREVSWYNELQSFPHVFTFNNKTWEWIAYDRYEEGTALDYVLRFGEVELAPELPVPSLEELFRSQWETVSKCECGAAYERGFENAHMFFCPRWSKE